MAVVRSSDTPSTSTKPQPDAAEPQPAAANARRQQRAAPSRWHARRAEPPTAAVFAATSAAVFALLLAHNSFVFSTRFHEGGDGAANSILAIHAKHFTQLVGNYSRIGFAHPGPAFIYVQAFGEWLFRDLLRIVPTPWNGQTIALFLLNAVLAGAELALVSDWFRSWLGAALGAGVLLAYFGAYGYAVASTWMPWLYVLPFLLLLTSAASVAAGRVRHLWALALSGGLLVHGHAEFLFFAPVITGVSLGALVYRRWRRHVERGVVRDHRRAWLLALGVAALFALPIAVNLALHWPGEIGRYLAYSRSASVGGHPLREAWQYALQFWPGRTPDGRRYVVCGLFAAAVVLAWRNPAGPARTFLRSAVAFVALGLALFVWYAANGIDHLDEAYVGYFSHALPALLATLVAFGAADLVRPALRRWWVARGVAGSVGVAAVAMGLLTAALSSTMDTPRHDNIANLPRVMAQLTAQAKGRPVVIELPESDPWPEMVGLLLAGERSGQRVCVDDPRWGFMVTDGLVCTDRDVRTGERIRLVTNDRVPQGAVVYGPLGRAAVLTAPE
jgi:hypothetical protein